jgi:hypothetical protein
MQFEGVVLAVITVSQRHVHPSIVFGNHAAADRLRLKAHPAKRGTLSRIRALKAEGFTTRQIAHELNQQGSTTRRRTAWRFQHVAEALETGLSSGEEKT